MGTKLKLIKIEDLNGNIWFQIFYKVCLSSYSNENEAMKEFELVAERLKRGLPKTETIKQIKI